MSIELKANKVLEQAKQLSTKSKSWADFSLELFDQHSGIVAKTFPDQFERQTFYDSRQYNEVNGLLAEVMKRTGLAKGADVSAEKSGRFNVRIPKTLHQSLEVEAKREGVSLNQLAVTKLSQPLRKQINTQWAKIVQAFADVHDGYSSDRIVVDPDYNGKFLRRCREMGLDGSDFDLNNTLYGTRKSKKQRERAGIVMPATTKKTEFRDYDGYQFASEISVRVLQRTEGVTLDHILCDPGLAKKFDDIALKLVNERILKLRWAALNLRKTHNLKPISPDVSHYDLVSKGQLRSVDLSSLSEFPGVYVFYDHTRPLYAGETDVLRKRIALHLQYGIPCVDIRQDEVVLKSFEMPGFTHAERVRWLMSFVNQERPVLNYQQAA
jgi:hypothetical protein